MFLHGLDPHHGLWDVVEAVAASRDTTFSKLKWDGHAEYVWT